MRACRTDKGVHAAGQVVSVKMLVKAKPATDIDITSDDMKDKAERVALEATVTQLNSLLPSDIRIFDIKRTVNSFHAKERCDSRFYEYLLPTYALASASPTAYLHPIPKPFQEHPPANGSSIQGKEGDSDDEAQALEEQEMDEQGVVDGVPSVASAESKEQWISKLTDEERQLISSYRIDESTLSKLSAFLAAYRGSHLYHNFTIGKSAKDPSCRRHIFDVILGAPRVQENIEWISITFHGQSFMLHQIRKMVGLAIMGIRLGCGTQLVTDCLKPTVKVNIPKAPSLGLLLDKAIFGGYNTKNESIHDPIDFDLYLAQRIALKNELIYPKIYEEEKQFNRFMGWLRCNDDHASEFPFLIPYIPSVEKVAS